MWKSVEGVETGLMEKPIVGVRPAADSPASCASRVDLPAPLRPRHTRECSGLLDRGEGGKHGRQTACKHCRKGLQYPLSLC